MPHTAHAFIPSWGPAVCLGVDAGRGLCPCPVRRRASAARRAGGHRAAAPRAPPGPARGRAPERPQWRAALLPGRGRGPGLLRPRGLPPRRPRLQQLQLRPAHGHAPGEEPAHGVPGPARLRPLRASVEWGVFPGGAARGPRGPAHGVGRGAVGAHGALLRRHARAGVRGATSRAHGGPRLRERAVGRGALLCHVEERARAAAPGRLASVSLPKRLLGLRAGDAGAARAGTRRSSSTAPVPRRHVPADAAGGGCRERPAQHGELSRTLFSTELLDYRFSAPERVTTPVLVIGGRYDGSIGRRACWRWPEPCPRPPSSSTSRAATSPTWRRRTASSRT